MNSEFYTLKILVGDLMEQVNCLKNNINIDLPEYRLNNSTANNILNLTRSTNVVSTVVLDIPTDNLDIANGRGYITSADIPTGNYDLILDSPTLLSFRDNGNNISSINMTPYLNTNKGLTNVTQQVNGEDITLTFTLEDNSTIQETLLDVVNVAQDPVIIGGVLNTSNELVFENSDNNTAFTIDVSSLQGGASNVYELTQTDTTDPNIKNLNLIENGNLKNSIALTLPSATSEVERVTQPPGSTSTFGYRFLNSDTGSRLTLGLQAMDFTTKWSLGTSHGASADQALAIGVGARALGERSTALGFNSLSVGDRSCSVNSGRAEGNFSFGVSLGVAYSYGETCVGTWPESYTPSSTTSYDVRDKMFVVANGQDSTSSRRKNALTVWKHGATQFHPIGLSEIVNPAAGMLIVDSEDNNRVKVYNGSTWVNLS